MANLSLTPAAFAHPAPAELALSGHWTALGTGAIQRQLDALILPAEKNLVIDGAAVEGLDTVGGVVVARISQPFTA